MLKFITMLVLAGLCLSAGSCEDKQEEDQKQMETTENYDPRFVTNYSKEDKQLKRFHDLGASDAYVAVAQKIVNDEPLNQAELVALGDEIDVMYKPADDNDQRHWHSLLSFSAQQENLNALKALLEAGADPNTEPNFASWASNAMTDPYLGAVEENFTFGIAATKLYLAEGGNYDYQDPITGDTLLSDFEVNQNIWSVDLLLEAGADPWLKDVHGVPFLDTLTFTPASLHTLRKTAEMGWFRQAPEGFINELMTDYFRGYNQFKDEPLMPHFRPDFRAFLNALINNSDYQPNAEILATLKDKD